MKLTVNKLLVYILSVGIVSCQDVVDIDTDQADQALSVYGIIDDTTGTEVTLNLTSPYFDQGEAPVIDDADVYLYEDDVLVGQLQKSAEPGVYKHPYKGQSGRAYYLDIILPDRYGLSENWRSVPEVLKRVFEPDSFKSVYLSRNTNPSVFEEGYYGLLYFTEPKGVGDNFRFRRTLNDSLFTQEFFIWDDRNFDGAEFGRAFPGFGVYGPMNPGDTLSLEISSLTGEYYQFLRLVNEQVFQIGGPFDPPPSPIIGNIYNADNPDQYGFGYFSASAKSFSKLVVNP